MEDEDKDEDKEDGEDGDNEEEEEEEDGGFAVGCQSGNEAVVGAVQEERDIRYENESDFST